MEAPKEFTIKQPRWLFILSLALGILGIIAIAVAIPFMILKKIDVNGVGGGIIALSCILLFVASIGIYSYFHDIFAYQNGFFLYKRVFCKTKRISVDTIYSAVAVGVKVVSFKDKNGECILWATDAYTLLESEGFKNVLNYYGITLTSLP